MEDMVLIMSDPVPALPEGVVVKPYVRFPAFSEWSSQGFALATFDGFATQLQNLKASSDPAALAELVEVATRWAAIDTGAIEGLYEVERGFTISMAVNAAVLDNIHAVKGEAVARTVEDALKAYEFVLDVATQAHPITEVWIRELHAIICASQEDYEVVTTVGLQRQELEKGVYKRHPNSPYNFEAGAVHGYASPLDTPSEMTRLIDELRSNEFNSAHPIVQAAYAHYAFVGIHPFADGNGRVSRALASVFLYRSPGLPLVIFADQKGEYIAALERADGGDYGTFVRFTSERVVDTIGMVKATIESVRAPSIESQLQQFQQMLTGRGGVPHEELDAHAVRLIESFQAAFTKVLAASFTGNAVTAQAQGLAGQPVSMPSGDYRQVPNNPLSIQVNMTTATPAAAQVSRQFQIVVARPDVEVPDFLILGPEVLLEVFLREVRPVITQALVYREESVVEKIVREMLMDLMARAENALRSQGYRE
jgi:Fic family protein